MAGHEVHASRHTTTGSVYVGRSRVRGLTVTSSAGAGGIILTDGNGGTARLTLDFIASATTPVDIPGGGILFDDEIYIGTLTNVTGVTIYYEG